MALIDFLPYTCLGILILVTAFAGTSKLPHRKVKIISVLGGAIAFGVFYVYGFWLGPLYHPADTIVDILYYTGPKGDLILVQDNTSVPFIRHSGEGRLTMIDAATGKVTNRVSTGTTYSDKNLDLQVLLDDKIWYTSYHNGFHARDPYTGEIVTDMEKMQAPYPQLNYRKASKVTTPEGYVFSRRPPDFELRVDSFPGNTVNCNETFMKYYNPPNHMYLYRKAWLKMWGKQDTSYTPLFWEHEIAVLDRKNGYCFRPMKGDDAMMQFMHAHTTFEGSYKYEGEYEIDTLINPQLQLRSGAIIENYLLHNPASVLIHYETIDSTFKTGFRVSRMDLKGKMIWEVSDEQMGGVPSFPYDRSDKTTPYTYNRGTLYIVVGTQVLALDGRTGKKKWSTDLGR